jgi:hypothetical protein
MFKKFFLLAFFFMVMCFAGSGCFRGGAFVGLGDGPYYDGPYRNGNVLLYYYDGGFYVYQAGDYRFDHYVPQDVRRYYDERYRKHHEQYHRDHPNSRNQHPGHSGQLPRVEEWKE